MMRYLFVLIAFLGLGLFSHVNEAQALFGGGPTCPGKYKNLKSADVDSDLYKGHCGLVICTNEGRAGIGGCTELQKAAYKKRKAMNCKPVPPTSQCIRNTR